MGSGFENALAEITLVIFTALAPSGVAAFVVMSLPLQFRELEPECREWINRFLSIPILVALVGLVASGTHLGTPGNALYVLNGIGRSPLSNEVFAGAIFFGLAGSYWFYSFTRVRRPLLERLWIGLSSVSAVVFIAAIAFAYHVDTIVTWAHPVIPVNLILNALVGGPLLALVGFAAVDVATRRQYGCPGISFLRMCVRVSGIALVANVAGYIVQGVCLLPLENSVISAAGLVPFYAPEVVMMFVLCGIGVIIDAYELRRGIRPNLQMAIVASVLSLLGIFIMRFAFYMLHMTVGIGF